MARVGSFRQVLTHIDVYLIKLDTRSWDERARLVSLQREEAAVAAQSTRRRMTMRTIVSALIGVSVFGLVALPASAFDAKTFYDQQDRESR